MHFCSNVVTREIGIGEAVLIRAVEPMQGIEMMITNRSQKKNKSNEIWNNGVLNNLTNGPARVSQAFKFGRKENGTDLMSDEIFIAHGERVPKTLIGTSPRVGINAAKEKKWRFFLKGNPFVSKP
jgi:DNA-3-methyladenine glycosylase